ncbi:MAG: O-antigen ligase family protein [Sedimenticola sp.]
MALVLGSCYVLANNIAYVGADDFFRGHLFGLLKILGYFFLPVFFISNIKILKNSLSVLVMGAIIGSVTVAMAAFGVVEFTVARYETSRVGVDWLPKSVGLISNYGDMAILTALFFLTMFVSKKYYYYFFLKNIPIKIVVSSVILLGIVSAQSRNVVLSSLIGIFILFFLGRKDFSVINKEKIIMQTLTMFVLALPVVVLAMLFSAEIISFIGNIGGKIASANVDVRLSSYEQGWKLFLKHPIFGIGAEGYIKNRFLIEQIHNIWFGILLKGGLLSLTFFLLILFNAFGGIARHLCAPGQGPEGKVLFALLFAILSASLYYPGHNSLLFWTVLGVITSLSCIPVEKTADKEKMV